MSISPNGTEIEESVHPCEDRAAKKAEEIFAEIRKTISSTRNLVATENALFNVAAELRVLHREISLLQSDYHDAHKNLVDAQAEIARLRAELAKVKP